MASKTGAAFSLFCLVSAGFGSLSFVHAMTQPSEEMSPLRLEDVLSSVDKFYPAIQSAEADLEAQRGKFGAARGAFDPKISANWGEHRDGYPNNDMIGAKASSQIPFTGVTADFGWDRTRGSFPVYEGDQQTGSDGRWKAGVTVPLLRDFLTDGARAGLKAEGLKTEEKEQSAKLVRLETYAKAAVAYWEWLARIEARKIVEDLLKLADQRDVFIGKRVHRGDAPAIDSVDSQRVILQRRAQLTKARQEQLNAELDLSLYLRTSDEVTVRPSPARALPWLDPKRAERRVGLKDIEAVIARYPGVRKLQFEVRQAEIQSRLANQNILPRLDLRLEAARYQGQLPSFRSDDSELFAGVQFSIPLFNFSARGKRQAAESELLSRRLELSLKEQQLRVELQQLDSETTAAREVFLTNYAEIDASDRIAAAERKKFERGDSTLFLVNARETDAALARVKAIGALLDFHQKQLKLRLVLDGSP